LLPQKQQKLVEDITAIPISFCVTRRVVFYEI